jgi:hypothetical protein
MCAPMIGLLGAAVSAAGSMAAANAQAANHEYNAKVEEIAARQRRIEGFKQSEVISDEFDRLQGRQQAATAAAGIDPFSGSAADVFEETLGERERERNVNYINAESKAVQHENRANQEKFQAKSVRQQGQISAASSLLGGLSGLVKGGFGSGLGASTVGAGSSYSPMPPLPTQGSYRVPLPSRNPWR